MNFSTFLINEATDIAAMEKRLKELKADLRDMDVTPTSQKMADAIDAARDEVRDMEAKIAAAKKSVKESVAPDAAGSYTARLQQVQGLVMEIMQAVALHAKKQKAAPDNWGHAGDMAHVAEQLQEVLTFLKGDAK